MPEWMIASLNADISARRSSCVEIIEEALARAKEGEGPRAFRSVREAALKDSAGKELDGVIQTIKTFA